MVGSEGNGEAVKGIPTQLVPDASGAEEVRLRKEGLDDSEEVYPERAEEANSYESSKSSKEGHDNNSGDNVSKGMVKGDNQTKKNRRKKGNEQAKRGDPSQLTL